ncbi:WSC-domain-containing protein, partial [Tilletiopsis washingtonensis]
TPATTTPSGTFKYGGVSRGCFADAAGTGGARSMNSASTGTNTMTNSQCANFCGDKGFKFSGSQYSSECYCSNVIPTVTSTACTMDCAGQVGEKCGGSWALTVFENTTTPATSAGPIAYLGCFKDVVSQRAMNDYVFTGTDMTTEKCQQGCSIRGYQYSGTEWSTECYCSKAAPTTTATNCNMPCGGNAAQTCGGSVALSVTRDPNAGTTSGSSGSGSTGSGSTGSGSTGSGSTGTGTATTCSGLAPGYAVCQNGQKVVNGACVAA